MGKVTTIAKTTRETVAIAMEMKRKKKKGRPSLADLSKRENNKPSVVRRSFRRNPNFESNSPPPEFEEEDEEEDEDEDERKQKKVKLVVRLPQQSNQNHNQHLENSSSAADSEPEIGDNHEVSVDTTKISSVDRRSDDAVSDLVLYFVFWISVVIFPQFFFLEGNLIYSKLKLKRPNSMYFYLWKK